MQGLLKSEATSAGTPRILLHFGNGIGLGHQVRCVNLAQAFLEMDPNAQVLLMGHTPNVRIIEDAGLPYVQASPIWSMPSPEREAYRRFLADVVRCFDPDIYVQDGESDPGSTSFFEDAIPVGAIRVLLLIRYSEERLRLIVQSPRWRAADLVVIAQDLDDFPSGIYSDDLRNLLSNNKCILSGPITRIATSSMLNAVREKYAIDANRLTVLFTAGAGGQHAHCDHPGSHDGDIFFSMIAGTCRSLEGRVCESRFIVIKGPYSTNDISFPGATVVDYEPALPALIRLADVVVLRPGYNSLNEVRVAGTPYVVIPSEATPESQVPLSTHLASLGLTVAVQMGDEAELTRIVGKLLSDKDGLRARRGQVLSSTGEIGNSRAARAILEVWRDRSRVS